MDIIVRVKELISIMTSNSLSELEVEEPDLKIRIRKTPPQMVVPPFMQAGPAMHYPAAPQGALQSGSGAEIPAVEGGEPVEEAGVVPVPSPMVGTFYRSNSPGGDPYVEEGALVEPDSVVCIIEAMKVMNEVKAEVSGEIVEVCVEDAQPVEFGQVLFRVRTHAS
jgi:acetyl-CoA carboxylase biotin carboxyl carrier protein